MTVQNLAADLAAAFFTATRDSGAEFARLRHGSPEWMSDAVCASHDAGRILPDDWRYRAVWAVAQRLADLDADADLDDAAEHIDGLVDVYTTALGDWLASSVHRPGYCDEALEDYGKPESTVQLLQWGQALEYAEVWAALVTFLRARADAA